MTVDELLALLPKWTQREVVEGGGRDPLGLSRVSDIFVDRLLPSIITTTDRARYYSFYPWAIREMERTEEADDEKFVEGFRRREAAFAVASKLGKTTELPIVGITQVNAKMGGMVDSGELDTAFPVLPSNQLGGLGQYYFGCLVRLGIADYRSKTDDPYLTTFEGRGEKLAEAFAQSISKTAIAELSQGDWVRIPAKILQKSAKLFSLDGIREPEARDERELLTRMFLELDEDTPSDAPLHRQAAIGQLLHVVEAYRKQEIEFPRKEVDQYALFWPHYYGKLYNPDSDGIDYVPPGPFASDSSYWRQFCAHQFFTYAAEEFLQAILDALSTTPEGLRREELIDALLETGFISDLGECLGVKTKGPADLLEFFGFEEGTVEEAEKSRGDFSGDYSLSEWNLIHGDFDPAPSTRLARCFAVWTQLYAKWRCSEDEALEEVLFNAKQEWSLGTCFDWGDQWAGERPDWRSVLEGMLDTFLVRHEEIKFQKHRLDATWFERSGDRYLKVQDLRVQFRASRHKNMVTVLQDLGLLEDGTLDDPLLPTKKAGKQLSEILRARS